MEGPYSGTVSVASSDFTIRLDQPAPASGVTCSITDPGSGDTITSTPVVIAEGETTGFFTITPGTTGPRTITLASATVVSTSQSLDVTGQQISYNSVAAGVVTSYRISFPFPSVGNINVASNDFTAILGDGSLGTGVSVEITPASNGGGSFDPTSVTLSDSTPSATFTYTPETSDAGLARSISATNLLSTMEMLDDPLPDTYTVNPIPVCNGYTFTGPITAPIGEQSGLFTITPTGTPTLQSDGTYSTTASFDGTITITDSRYPGTPVDYVFSSSSTPQTFRVTASGSPGDTFTLTPTYQSGTPTLSDPPALTVTAQAYAEINDTFTLPYSLPTTNTYYRLTSDITATGSAFYLGLNNVTLDLNGHTVIYDNATPIDDILNGGFESGDFTDWDTSGVDINTEVVPATIGFWGHRMAHIYDDGTSDVVPSAQTLVSSAINIPTSGISYVAMLQTDNDYGSGRVNLVIYDNTTGLPIASGVKMIDDPVVSSWSPTGGGTTFLEFVPSTDNNVKVGFVITPQRLTDGMSAVNWSIRNGGPTDTELLFGTVNQQLRPSGTTYGGRPFTYITTSATPSGTSLTVMLTDNGSDSNHAVYGDAALIELASGSGSTTVIDNSDAASGSVNGATTWSNSTSFPLYYGSNYQWVAAGGNGSNYIYWTFTGLTANSTYRIALTWPSPRLTSIHLDHVAVWRSGVDINGIRSTDKSGVCITSSTPGGSGAAAGAITIDSNGTITNIAVGSPGSGYTSPPLVFITNGPEDSYGTGAIVIASINGSGQVTGFTVTSGGSAYTSARVHIMSGGCIVQGQARSYQARPIEYSGVNNSQIDNIGIFGWGSDIDLIRMRYCYNMAILNNFMVGNVEIMSNRQAARSFVQDFNKNTDIDGGGTKRFENNILVGQHQNGYASDSSSDGISVKNNKIYQNSAWTDGYSIGVSEWFNFEIAYNTIRPLSGRGILFQGNEYLYHQIENGTVHDNYVDVQERYNLEYGALGLTATAFRLRNYDARFDNCTVSNNIFRARTGKAGQDIEACAVRVTMRDNFGYANNANFVFENNLMKGVVTDYDSTLNWQSAMALDIAGYEQNIGFIFKNNVYESNCTSLSLGSNDALMTWEKDVNLISNTIKKSSDGIAVVRSMNDGYPRSHVSVVAGSWGHLVQDVRLIDTQYVNGASTIGEPPDGLELVGNADNNFSTGWLLDVTIYMNDGVTPAGGATVTVTDKWSNQKTYIADSNGVVTGIEVLTTTYTIDQYLSDGTPANQEAHRHTTTNNPFTIAASLSGKTASLTNQTFNANSSKTLSLSP